MKITGQDRLFAALGIGSVVAELAGFAIGSIGGRPFVTITSSPADVRSAFGSSVTTAAWVGAYVECSASECSSPSPSGRPRNSAAGRSARSQPPRQRYAAVSIGALGIGDALAYRAGHGMGVQLASTLVTLNEAVYVCTWFLSVFYLLAIAPMALAAGRR